MGCHLISVHTSVSASAFLLTALLSPSPAVFFSISPSVIQSLPMADLYPPSYPPRQQQPQPYHPRDSQSYQLNQPSNLSYPAIMSSQQNHQQQQPQQQQQQQQQQHPPSGSLSPDDEHPQKQPDQPTTPKPDQPGHSKPQATFLTKLYALVPSRSPPRAVLPPPFVLLFLSI